MVNYSYKKIENLQDNMHHWFKPKINQKDLKELMKRRDGPAWLNTICFFSVFFISGYFAFLSWGTWWAVPAFFIYGSIYALGFNARWHEFGHRSAFKTRWLNDLFYEISSFLCYFESFSWKWSHIHHHSRTIHLNVDYEIQVSRPANLFNLFVKDVFAIDRVWAEFKKVFFHSLGIMTPFAKDCVPEDQRWKMVWNSRLYMAIKIGFIYWAFHIGSFLPCMFIVLPNMYGSCLLQFVAMTQHGGLKANSYDHRENTRTFYTGPILGWLLYFNMQYHIEHHIFPQVPFHNLPKLHEAIKDQLPEPNSSFFDALKEMIPAIIKQSKDPNYYVSKELPS